MKMSKWVDAPGNISILIERHHDLGKIVIEIFIDSQWTESHVMHWTESKTINFEFEEPDVKGLLGDFDVIHARSREITDGPD